MVWNVGNGHNTKRIQVAEMKFLKCVEAAGLLDWEWNEVQRKKKTKCFKFKMRAVSTSWEVHSRWAGPQIHNLLGNPKDHLYSRIPTTVLFPNIV